MTNPDLRHIAVILDRSGSMQTSPSDTLRFFAQVDAAGPCWEWQGLCNGDGYGRFITFRGGVQVETGAHRWAWLRLVGPIPEGLVLDHLCRVPRCVNPDHLEPVTQAENLRRGWNANRKKSHCPAGHPYVADNIKITSAGGRACRTCAGQTGRGRAWEASKTHCPQGHPYDEANTYVSGGGHRHCRACRRERERNRYRAKARAAATTSSGLHAFSDDERDDSA